MIFIVGPMPPPMHGAAAVTEAVAVLCRERQVPLRIADTAPIAGTSGWRYHLSRLRRYAAATWALATAPAGQGVYHSLSGGLGLLYDLAAVAACRLRGREVVFHHHSFAYLHKRSAIMAAIVRLTGTRALHLVLCPSMGERLAEIYGPGLRIGALSNLAFFDLDADPPETGPRTFRTIGYLSNVTREKGGDRFLDALEAARARGSRITGAIAGPINDPDLEREMRARAAAIGGVDLAGPLYGEAKARFLAEIDLFVFPSRYHNEAQPLVLFEALAAGTPVVGTRRGCMPDLPPGDAVLLLDPNAGDLSPLVDRMMAWEADPAAYAAARAAVVRERREMRTTAQRDRDRMTVILERLARGLPADDAERGQEVRS